MKVAIQGVKASFHDVAAREYFRGQELELVECKTFRELCESLAKGRSERALMAIENSIAGSILPNYSLLESFHFKILGEVFLRVELCFMALPGQNLENLKTVESHPMALFQCEDFLHTQPHLKILEAEDTAEVARKIHNENLRGHSTIASALAAETYGLQILRKNVETNSLNYTRFLVIAAQSQKVERANKSSLRFETGHQSGSLVKVLKIFEVFGLNMTKIQSVPIPGLPYQYSFHVDLEFDKQDDYEKAIEAVRGKALNLIQLGEYPRGLKKWE